jgi:hypothetical protein
MSASTIEPVQVLVTSPDDHLAIVLAKVNGTAAGQVRLAHFAPLFTRVAEGCLDEATRPGAEAMMKDWASGDDPLAKGLAQHWIDRAKATVEHGMKPGTKPGKKVHPLIAKILASKKSKPVAAAT